MTMAREAVKTARQSVIRLASFCAVFAVLACRTGRVARVLHPGAVPSDAGMARARITLKAVFQRRGNMAYSSILGADQAPAQPSGRDAELLGPSDNSDSGSDTLGTHEAYADSDAVGTGERGSATPGEAREGADILPDRVVRRGPGDDEADDNALATGEGFPAADPDAREFTDLDADAERTEDE